MRVVVDTNVLVSGLLSPHGAPGRIVEGLVIGELRALFDDRILAEHLDVLARPKFKFDPGDVDEVLTYIAARGDHLIVAPLGVELPDPDDLAFLEVAVAGRARALVTGNHRHFPEDLRCELLVLSSADFLRMWAEER